MSYKLTTNMLAYRRSFEISAAKMFGTNSKDDSSRDYPIIVQTEGVRGQSAHANDTKGNAGKSNIQMVDVSRVPIDCDTLAIEFAMRIMPNSISPSASDNGEAQSNLCKVVQGYKNAKGFDELAARYLENIANGRFAWRNRGLSDEAIVTISTNDTEVSFNPFSLSLDEIMGVDAIKSSVISGNPDDVDTIISKIAFGLSENPVNFTVKWVGTVSPLAEVYPSQEYTGSEKPADKNNKLPSRVLASMPSMDRGSKIRQAVMHSQKIGAAIRCIDDWHGDESHGPVPVNPFAGVQEAGVVLRHPDVKAKSLYDIIKKPDAMIKSIESGNLDGDCHFFVANLIRGGVFGSK